MCLIELKDIKKKIRVNQNDALCIIEEYLNSDEIDEQALIAMPTGAGKTGVMAIVSNFYGDSKNVLIIVPNAALPNQTQREIEFDFWNKIGVNSKQIKLKSVFQKENITEFFTACDNSGAILVITIQSLLFMHKNKRDEYECLKSQIDLIIYDEGHREPSDEWSEISREFDKKTILFTATPYRNDNNSFKTSSGRFKFVYSFEQAVIDKVIKDIKFIGFESKLINESEFNALIDFIMEVYNQNKTRKILIRCKGSDHIKKVASSINSKNDKQIAIGCHSKLGKGEDCISEGKKIYDKIKNISIIVHENMLIEGIDNPEIDVLFLLEKFRNSKTLVQQIGRLVRRNNIDSPAIVYVPQNQLEEQVERWNDYKSFDMNFSDDSFEQIQQVYKDGKFRTQFVLNDDFYKYLLIPKAANFYYSENTVFEDSITVIRESLVGKVAIGNSKEHKTNNLWIMCYEKLGYSNILIHEAYLEKTLEIVLLKEIIMDNKFYVAFYDSHGFLFPLDLINDLQHISVNSLYNLFPEDTKFNHLKLNSIGINSTGVFSRRLDGINLEDMNTNIKEKFSYCKNVSGIIYESTNKKSNRYIGATSSRVNDFQRGTLDDFNSWSKKIIRQIVSSGDNKFFKRYSSAFIPTAKMTPSSILIDFSSILRDSCTINYKGTQVCNIESISCDCKDNKFYFDFADVHVIVTIEFNKKRKNKVYQLVSSELRSFEIQFPDSIRMNLLEYINKNRCFSIFFAENGVIYNRETFFEPNLIFKQTILDELDLGRRIQILDGLDKCINEKTGSIQQNEDSLKDWPLDSIFGLFVSEARANNFSSVNFTSIVCDDLGCEIADFIAIDEENNKIVLIHCKHSNSKLSASSFQEVCGQALKNLSYIIKNNTRLHQDVTKHIERWNSKWEHTIPNLRVSLKFDRFVLGALDGKQFWDKFTKIRERVDSTVEVWLVTNGLSRNALQAELLEARPKEQVNQLMWILYGTQEVLAEAGAELKVFCKA